MRFLLFYGNIDPLNHFTSELDAELRNKGHQTSFVDLRGEWQEAMQAILNDHIDAAICYDGIGDFCTEVFDRLGIPLINILMDHPMDKISCVQKRANKYILLCPDENHVVYSKRFFGIQNTFFMPHMASLSVEFHQTPYEKKDMDLLFPGSLGSCNALYKQIIERWPSENSRQLALATLECLLENPGKTVEAVFTDILTDKNMELSDSAIAAFLGVSKEIDIFVRMYYRENIITKIIQADIPITLIGSGWNKPIYTGKRNVTVLEKQTFAAIFSYMERSKITFTVMPWFKAGTHDRIFNALMHYSCPLTDESSWLLEHLKPDEECAYYSLENMDEIPYKIYQLLNHPELQHKIIQNGREKVLNNYTSRQITEQILQHLEECYG